MMLFKFLSDTPPKTGLVMDFKVDQVDMGRGENTRSCGRILWIIRGRSTIKADSLPHQRQQCATSAQSYLSPMKTTFYS